MKFSSSRDLVVVLSFATEATSRILVRQPTTIDYNAAPPNLSTLANNSLFETWRPKAHVLPAFGQIGDPCMHYTDPATGLFHVGYLHLGASGATTNDLVTYKDLNPNSAPFIRAGGVNDPVAVFDGSVIEKGVNGTPTLLYTSVSYLPIQWTIRYTRGSETQSLAYATDGGKNFTKAKFGPVIPSPPFAVNVTGFRDPFVFQSPQFDSLLSKKKDTWYTLISGGVHGVGPSLFLYAQYDDSDSASFQTWEYLGEYWHEAANTTWTESNWAGRWGFNFEVANIFSLDEHGANPSTGETFLTVGAEWSYAPIVPQVSDERDMLWIAGTQSLVDGKLTFEPTMAGRLDAGRSAYAAAGKLLSADSQPSWASGAPDRAITYLWLTGDLYGTSPFPTAQQNWTGSLLLPRELSRCYIDVLDTPLARETGAWRIERESGDGTLRLATLCQKLAREVKTAFKANATNVLTLPANQLSPGEQRKLSHTPKQNHYMLTASLTFSSRTPGLKAGLTILSGAHETTRIIYDIGSELLSVERGRSSAAANTTQGIPTYDEEGRFRLFDLPAHANASRIETLNLSVVVDGGVVEVHANDRFALSTWVRPWYADSKSIGVFVEGEGEEKVSVGEVKVYEGLVDAWPKRNKRI
ncbi:glycoside hydrolase family 32 protein [Bipolaris zeicola 26-R-13]|uniref:Glycoside hydrolase family 32 protein n=1 Tax=Cochliobolus carbonum (strain 26-R-13) TaxID=930089 RepID=W6Y1K5_COCC2|nr:glycoside hydrolase family 32 protein [Bipolaris zeicola 26-R-13]EUC31783.1 glycoside hydrolase family 32 protein [Bipolaris zeicola 26-R-13]